MSNQQNDIYYENLEEFLQELPDKVADALSAWRIATLQREKVEAMLHLRLKAEGEKMSVGDLKAAINNNQERYDMMLKEILAESEYNRLYEKLLSAKKRASLRTAF